MPLQGWAVAGDCSPAAAQVLGEEGAGVPIVLQRGDAWFGAEQNTPHGQMLEQNLII